MPDAPRIITARKLGFTFVVKWGQLGPERNLTGHYSAGARAKTWRDGVRLAREFHAFHRDTRGWGGLAYHFVIADDGALICGRPTLFKGAHVGGHNTQNLGVNCPGTTGDRPTDAQQQTFVWLLANAHTDALPKAHRTDVDLSTARRFVHNMWSGHESNGCAGLFKAMFVGDVRRGEEEDFPTPEDAYPEAVELGGMSADHRHVSPEEAEQAEEGEEMAPEADPDFDEDAALQGADPDAA